MERNMELRSGLRTPEQLWPEVQEIAALLTRLQIDELTVFYGFGCDLEMDELYTEREIKTSNLLEFISKSMAAGFFLLGESDFFIQSRPAGVEFLLCHESDVHLKTDNAEVASHMRVRWAAQEPPGYEESAQGWDQMSAT